MKKFLALIVSLVTLGGAAAFAVEQPSVYVIQKGDTLWGLSERFFSDPWYWPDLWAKNPDIANPHLIFPGQKVKVYADRIVPQIAEWAKIPDPADRILITLKYHDNLKYEQISQRTGLSVGNIGYKLHHALKNLADSLRRLGVESADG